MALADAQRSSVRRYLGWSGKHFRTDTRLEQAMDQIATVPEDEATVVGLLADCDSVMAKIREIVTNTSEAVQVGTIQRREPYQLEGLRVIGRLFANQLSTMLGVPIRGDAFGTGGLSGFAGPHGVEPGGNYLPMG